MRVGFISGWGSDEKFSLPFMNALSDFAVADGGVENIEVQYFPWVDVLHAIKSNDTEALSQMFSDVDILMGWSLGGLLALHTPVKNVVLVSSFVKYIKGDEDGAVGVDASALGTMMMGLRISKKAVAKGFAKLGFSDDSHDSHGINWQDDFIRSCMGLSVNHLYDGLDFLSTGDARGMLAGRSILIIHGDSDRVAPFEMALYTESIAKDDATRCKVCAVENAGHNLLPQHELIFNEVSSFYGLK